MRSPVRSPSTSLTLTILSKCCAAWAAGIRCDGGSDRRRQALACSVLIDGYVATAAAAVLHAMAPSALDHCLAAHCSAEPAHRALLEKIGKEPLLDLGMRLGEATGAALAAALIKAAANLHTGMATFESAGVSDKAG